MTVLTRSLGDRENWQMGYSIEAKLALRGVPERHRRNSVNDFLAEDRGRRAKESLVGLLLVMFPNTPDDVDDSDD